MVATQSTRVVWTDEEGRLVLDELVRILKADPRLSDAEAFRRAFRSALPPERHPQGIPGSIRTRGMRYLQRAEAILRGEPSPPPPPPPPDGPVVVKLRGKGRRVMWTQVEAEAVLRKMEELRREHGESDPEFLFRVSYEQVLPEERHLRLVPSQIRRRAAEFYAKLGPMPEPPAPAPEPEPEPDYRPEYELPEPPPPDGSPRGLAHQLVDRLFAREQAGQALEERMAALEREVRGTAEQVGRFYGMLTRILGDLADYLPPSEAKPPMPATANLPPPLNGTGFTVPRPLLPRKLRVGVIGPMPHQAAAIQTRVQDVATVKLLDKEKERDVKAELGSCDYIVITRHASHAYIDSARDAVGRGRVVQLQSSGLETVVHRIRGLAGQGGGEQP